MTTIKNVLITGGAGYVGAVLTPKLLEAGYRVVVYDLFLYGHEVLDGCRAHPLLRKVQADIRDLDRFAAELRGVDAVIHLACISNDPSFELAPDLGKSINYDCFPGMVLAAKNAGVKRFIYASSSSVYGIKDEDAVTEDLPLEPLTDYSKFKALCEDVLHRAREPGFETLIIRPATVCGYSPRLRLDLVVNILTNHAVTNRRIKVFGGDQKRPNVHIEDMTDLYLNSLRWPAAKIDGEIFNFGFENHRVHELGALVRREVGDDVAVEVLPTDDHRSYHVSSAKIERQLGYTPRHSIQQAVRDLVTAFGKGLIPDSMSASRYYNIKRMQEVKLT